jgi:DNA-binding NtrC family response regulator
MSKKRSLSPEIINLFIEYPWKGNVRELENVIERMVLLSDKDEITVEDMPKEMLRSSDDVQSLPEVDKKGIDLDNIMNNTEKSYLLNSLKLTNGNKTEAAKLLNISFRSFRHRLSKYDIK